VKSTRKIRPRNHPLPALLKACLLAGFSLSSVAQTPVALHPAAALPPTPGPPAETRIFPLAELHTGQTGVAYTVFQGTQPEPMQVEILGLLKNSLGPGQDMILARLHGTKPEYTGVVAGMSGSPVYIDGRLLGALSYRIGQFSKEPIAGITPIEQMFEVRDRAPAVASSDKNPQITPIETPLVASGVSQDTLDRFGDRFRALGLTPIAGLGGSADPNAKQPEPLIPGSAVSAVLVRGDLSMFATCTVTYVDPTRLLACGHPFTQYGAVDIPMTKASVVATLASPLNAFKIVNSTETVGAFTEDRSSAIMGIFGRKARMIPISVEVSSAPGSRSDAATQTPHTFHYEVLDNPSLTPNAVLVSVYQSLHGTNRAGEQTSYRVTGDLSVHGFPAVHLNSLVAPSDVQPAAIAVALYLNESFSRVYGSTVDKPILTGLHLQIEALPDRRSAVLESATLSRSEAHAGDTLQVQATLRPYQGATRTVTLPVHLPGTLAPGPIRIVVADGATIDRLTQPSSRSAGHASGLADTIAALNRAPQALLEGATLPQLPLSMANVFEPLKQTQEFQLNGESVLSLSSAETGYALSGAQVLSLTIH
jgi:hypothetical protein